ncbi:MAG: MATE family efflux transporter [Opitutales bacterium]|nr:MATE family efflux transporter [Opitutales bacterium]
MSSPTLTQGPIGPHIRKIALPMSIGFFFNTMYNVVDSFYAGQISTQALAAMALCFPVFFIIIALSEGVSRGSSALIANSIGAEDREKESAFTSQVFSLGFFFAIGITITGLNVAPPLFRLMGASGDYFQLADDYISPLFWGSAFFLLSSLSNSILIAHGDSKTFGKVLVAGFFLNLVLNPWFLYGGFGVPAMGIAGIAWATVVIQAAGGIFLLTTVLRRKYIHISGIRELMPKLKIYGEILHQGIPTAFNMMSIALGFFVSTYYLNTYSEVAVAAFGVGTRIEQMALLPAIGLGTAIVSIVGQNNGARRFDRVRECVTLCIKYGFVIIAVASLIMYIFATPLVRLFTDDPAVISTGTDYVRIMTFIQWAYVMTFTHTGFLQAVKRPMYGFIESIIRKIILPIGIFYLLVNVLAVKLNEFLYGMAAINVVMTFVTIVYAQWVLRKKLGDSEETQPA